MYLTGEGFPFLVRLVFLVVSLAQYSYGCEGEKDTQSDPAGLVVDSGSAVVIPGGNTCAGLIEFVCVVCSHFILVGLLILTPLICSSWRSCV